MKEEFENLFEYSNHYNQLLISLISENHQNVSEKVVKLMNHIINAHQIWNARITNEKQFDVWQINNWDQNSTIDNDNYNKTLKIISGCNLNDPIEYKKSKGTIFTNKIKDILFHVVNHSTYHRAQIATELKNCGIEPINTDYIFYKRKTE